MTLGLGISCVLVHRQLRNQLRFGSDSRRPRSFTLTPCDKFEKATTQFADFLAVAVERFYRIIDLCRNQLYSYPQTRLLCITNMPDRCIRRSVRNTDSYCFITSPRAPRASHSSDERRAGCFIPYYSINSNW